MSPVMTISSNGQVSIPAATRARWNAKKVVVVDMGDYVVIRPALDDPVKALRGKYLRPGPNTDEMRRIAREEDAEHEARRGR